MRKNLWFKRKVYGFGWTPAAWQGWLTIFLYVVVNGFVFRIIDLNSHSGSDTLIAFAPRFLLLTLGLYFICYVAGEKPKLQWGNANKNGK